MSPRGPADATHDDGFPATGVLAIVTRLPAYGRLAWNLSRDPDVPTARRAAVLASAAYLVSPIDAVPGFIPLVGQIDDVLVVLSGIHFALAGLDAQQRAEHLRAAGMTAEEARRDLATIRRAAAWMTRQAAELLGLGARAIRRGLAPRGSRSASSLRARARGLVERSSPPSGASSGGG